MTRRTGPPAVGGAGGGAPAATGGVGAAAGPAAIALLFLLPFTLYPSPSFAQTELVVSSRVDKVRLTETEPLTFSVTIAGPIRTTPRVTLSSLEGFQVVSTGQSQQVNIRGGEMQLAITLQYLLAPTAPGTHTLGPVVVEYEGRQYETAPIEVEVLPAGRERPAPAPSRRYPPVRGGTVL